MSLWGMSLAFWALWGERLLVIGGVMGFASLVASVSSALILNRVASVQNDELTIKAREFSERTGQLELKLANARQETERIKQLAAWREISLAQANSLEDALRGKRFSVGIVILPSDNGEAVEYARSLAQALKMAGLNTDVTNKFFSMPGEQPVFGIAVGGHVPRARSDLQAALEHAKIPTVPNQYEGFSVGDATIFVGSKPKPF
jgi:hypothetical protein